MKYTNANSFKAQIKNIAKWKELPAQQVQQNYLIEQILRLITKSKYQQCFIVKGGYLISNLIGIDKRTTMDLDVTVKDMVFSKENLIAIFNDIFSDTKSGGFQFKVDSVQAIRPDDDYGGYEIKIKVNFDTLREVVFIDVTTGDSITPKEINYVIKSIFSEDNILIMSYNLETVLAEKLETVITRGEGSTRPRDRYDLLTILKLREDEVNFSILKTALINTATKRGTLDTLTNWQIQIDNIRKSDYQKQLWTKYQHSFKYAAEISFEQSINIIEIIMRKLE